VTRPVSSYRLQLSPAFTLHDALAVLPYLNRLGVHHLYLSPILAARPGSAHGYDVVDPTRVSGELGGEQALRALADAASERGMGLTADIVPNHMAADESNPWWWDVLRSGRESPHAVAFDIDWEAPAAAGRLVLPVLGEALDDALASGAVHAVDDGDGPLVGYHDRRFPLAPGSEGLALSDLAAALREQRYELCFWREGLERLNYRRFFDVSDLVALRADDPEVFRRSHELVLRLVREGVLQGLRVDHVDGLADPGAYLRRLREGAPGAYIVVEKILASDEAVPHDWPVEGTTGYEFLACAGGLFVDPGGAAAMAETYVAATGRPAAFERTALRAKREALRRLFAPDTDRVLRRAEAAGLGTPSDLREPLAALTVHLDAYRTYADSGGLSPEDRGRLERATHAAAEEVADVKALRRLAAAVEAPGERTLPFVQGWQQLTGPVAAKGVEDTALYRDTRLLARNEPGLDPSFMSATPRQLHAWCAGQAARHPMTTTSTHDTKRGEDVRSRIAALTLVPERWAAFWERWRDPALNGADASADWLALQTLAGSYPAGGDGYPDRISAYLVKALREAKEGTSWLDPDEAYEARAVGRTRELLADRDFAEAVGALAGELERLGAAISLGQLVAKLIAPGCPDVYWGNERTRLTLVDPDNRGPVDFEGNDRLLRELEHRHAEDAEGLAKELAATIEDGRMKLLMTHLGLRLRRRRERLFANARYVAVDGGAGVYAAARQHEGEWVLGVAGLRPGTPFADLALERAGGMPERWRDVLTGRIVELSDTPLTVLLAASPATMLEPV
jgi:(1->4)-alpha-D-glucan 1-alpha-D-glucosylmutase